MARSPRNERPEALALLADGLSPSEVARHLGIPETTVYTWARRHLTKQKAEPPASPPGPIEATDGAQIDESPSVGLVDGELLADMTTAEYLRTRLALIESALSRMLTGSSVPWGTLGTLVKIQADLHRELVSAVRAEGSALDLSEDPRAIALEAQRLTEELRILGLDLSDVSGLQGTEQ